MYQLRKDNRPKINGSYAKPPFLRLAPCSIVTYILFFSNYICEIILKYIIIICINNRIFVRIFTEKKKVFKFLKMEFELSVFKSSKRHSLSLFFSYRFEILYSIWQFSLTTQSKRYLNNCTA